jgi:hypothetical protein
MMSMVDILPIVQLPTVILPQNFLPKSDVSVDDNNTSIDQFSDRYEESRLIQGNGRRQF